MEWVWARNESQTFFPKYDMITFIFSPYMHLHSSTSCTHTVSATWSRRDMRYTACSAGSTTDAKTLAPRGLNARLPGTALSASLLEPQRLSRCSPRSPISLCSTLSSAGIWGVRERKIEPRPAGIRGERRELEKRAKIKAYEENNERR